MQKSPKVAMLEVIAKATHHQRGAGCSATPEIRSVNQLKLRRCNTSGTRVSCCSASPIVSGAVGAPSMLLVRGHPEPRRQCQSGSDRGTSLWVIDHATDICVH